MPPGLRLRNRTVSWPSLASLNPQAWRSMCGCTLNGIFAAFPSFVIILRKPTALMGAPRSLKNSNALALARGEGDARRAVRCRWVGGPTVCYS